MSTTYPTVTYDRPTGTKITVRDTDGNREQAKSLGWTEVTESAPKKAPKKAAKKADDDA